MPALFRERRMRELGLVYGPPADRLRINDSLLEVKMFGFSGGVDGTVKV